MMHEAHTRPAQEAPPTSMPRSSSPSSSLSSVASAGSMLPAAPSSSSQSDVAYADSSDWHTSPTNYKQSPLFPAPRSSSLATMGQSHPHSPAPLLLPSASAACELSPGSGGLSAGQKFKRAFGGRRKKPEDIGNSYPRPPSPSSKGKGKNKWRARQDSFASESDHSSTPSLTSSSLSHSSQSHDVPFRRPSAARQLTLHLASSTLHVLTGKKSSPIVQSPTSPPPLPPKPYGLKGPTAPTFPTADASNHSLTVESSQPNIPVDHKDKRGSVMAASPGIFPALAYMSQDGMTSTRPVEEEDRQKVEVEPESDTPAGIDTNATGLARRREKTVEQEQHAKETEDWRKSDSTMRNVQRGGRTPTRPLSVAESSCSGHTVVPVAGKRMSTLVTDGEFATLEMDTEEEEAQFATVYATPESHTDDEIVGAPAVPRLLPLPTAKPSHRRSMSLNFENLVSKARLSESVPMYGLSSGGETRSSAALYTSPGCTAPLAASIAGEADAPILTTAAASGDITQYHSSEDMSPTTGNNFRGRLAAWTSSTAKSSTSSLSLSRTTSSSSHDRKLLQEPQSEARPRPSRSSAGSQPRGLRQTAISMSNGLVPAAGLAMGFGKRAVDRLGRAWGGGNSNASTASGYSSSSSSNGPARSGTPPTSFFSAAANKLGRVHSNQLPLETGNTSDGHRRGLRQHRRTADGHSGTWSVASSVSDGETGQQVQPGPNLGTRLRAPMRPGLVFGRDLATCVRDTGVTLRKSGGFGMDMEIVGARALESRALPALVLRCAQHLEKWGVQEEGLFRIPGRPSHVSMLRSEFDAGADYDMSECGPGEIDAHAVASVFKAYLRELPEPLLTRPLIPYFEAAMSAESSATTADENVNISKGAKGPSLPSGPKAAHHVLGKPPSLSTFALPTLSTRVPSDTLLNALAALIARLPTENRDVLRTVAELIKATAQRSKETKMPLSNLLLVFCPSLAMSPPLLRVLCEGEGIWNGPPKGVEDPFVVDIKREEPDAPHDEDTGSDKLPSSDTLPSDSEKNEQASNEEKTASRHSMKLGTLGLGPRPRGGVRRVAIPTLYVDDSFDDTSSVDSPSVDSHSLDEPTKSDSIPTALDVSVEDDTSRILYNPYPSNFSTSSDRGSVKEGASPGAYNSHSPHDLTSSSDSLSTPSNSSGSEVQDASKVSLVPEHIENIEKAITDDQTELPSPQPATIRQSIFGVPVRFPSTGSAPSTPVSLRPKPKISTHSISSPSLLPMMDSPTRPVRSKKPSLQLLFHKRSVSSLLSLSQSSPAPPLTPRTPQSSISSTPPVLDMALETSPFSADLNSFDGLQARLQSGAAVNTPEGASPQLSPSPSDTTMKSESDTEFSRASSGSSVFAPTVYYTPISRHRGLDTQPSQASFKTAPSTYSLYELDGEYKQEEDDWAKSVLLAADVSGAGEGQIIHATD